MRKSNVGLFVGLSAIIRIIVLFSFEYCQIFCQSTQKDVFLKVYTIEWNRFRVWNHYMYPCRDQDGNDSFLFRKKRNVIGYNGSSDHPLGKFRNKTANKSPMLVNSDWIKWRHNRSKAAKKYENFDITRQYVDVCAMQCCVMSPFLLLCCFRCARRRQL